MSTAILVADTSGRREIFARSRYAPPRRGDWRRPALWTRCVEESGLDRLEGETVNEDTTCIFCQIVRGNALCHRIYEDAETLAMMDIFPVTDGHVLVITKPHFPDIFTATESALIAVATTAHRVAAAIRTTLHPDGLMVFQLNGAAAMQTVFHYHMHLLPRAADEPLALHTRVPGDPARLATLAQRIAANMLTPTRDP
jgi:histidine triad (HIT) family protein